MKLPERRHELTRLEGFSDAVFAFALTLLVVSLEVPHTFRDLEQLVRGFLPFGLTFAMICWIWYEHQHFFRKYDLQDAGTVAMNCLLLFVILFYVYPLKYLTVRLLGPWLGMLDPETGRAMTASEFEHGDLVMVLYSSGVVLIFGTLAAMYWHARRRRADLGLSGRDLIELDSGFRAHGISVVLGVLSIAIVGVGRWTDAPAWFAVAGFIYILLGPLHAWNGAATGKALAAYDKKAAAVVRT